MRHGIYIKESSTGLVSSKTSETVTVAIGVAPINLVESGDRKVNEPVLCYSESEVKKYLGKSANTEAYGLSEVSDVFFKYYNVGPVVFINVLDPQTHKTTITDEDVTVNVATNQGILSKKGVLLETIVLKSADNQTTYAVDVDYVVSFDSDENAVITTLEGGSITGTPKATFDYINPSLVDKDDVIGGENSQGVRTGLELIDEVYARLGVVSRQLIHPGFNESDLVAVGNSKMQGILGTCKGLQWIDAEATGATAVYIGVPTWKQTNGIVGENQILCWGRVTLGGKKHFLSTHGAALKASVDYTNGDVPSESPSNKPLKIDGFVLADGSEIALDQARANYLNANGIVTVFNNKLWGNYTAAITETTDVKDTFIPVRDMFNWAGISTVLTFANKIDKPGNYNLIESVVDSKNIWLNGLTADGHIYGGRIAFRKEDNQLTDLLQGKFTYKTYLSPVIPHQEMVEDMEYDPTYLETLFN